MELLIGLAAIVVVIALLIIRASKNTNSITVGETVTEILDVNNDGKVDVEDAKAVVEKAKTTVKKAATKSKPAPKKSASRGRKPKAQ